MQLTSTTMKTILTTILLLCICVASYSTTPLAMFYDISATTFKQGETGHLRIYFPPGGYTNKDTFTVNLWYSTGEFYLIHKIAFLDMEVDLQGYHVGYFTIPLNANLGEAKIIPYTATNPIINITSSQPPVTTSIEYAEVMSLNLPIHYYDQIGTEIEKPSKGFFIWKIESGVSGKVVIE
jgi:hypothetical protein